ncbi:hypothetical protein LLEC1_04692 [Akanthomyces lecanii]|uniref:Uncharacterized protein n=1 Tax=Cordyceps confragosa TaxID=2714763 RepID=A0A179I9B4_CORDF|nr:hypothetical protein LLEC1_04692 [Akanthomyces lecanii]
MSQIYATDGFKRTPFAVAACQHGIFTTHIFDNIHLDYPDFSPLERLRIGQTLPKKIFSTETQTLRRIFEGQTSLRTSCGKAYQMSCWETMLWLEKTTCLSLIKRPESASPRTLCILFLRHGLV